MKGTLPLWVEHLETDPEVRQQVQAVSVAAIDRLLSLVKMGGVRKKALLSQNDAAICGGDMGGNFIWSLTTVEILSSWRRCAACGIADDRRSWPDFRALSKLSPSRIRRGALELATVPRANRS